MIGLFDHLARPLLRRLDPETAHGLAVGALKAVPLRPGMMYGTSGISGTAVAIGS